MINQNRRRFLKSIGFLSVLSDNLNLVQAQDTASAREWPQPGYDAANTGHALTGRSPVDGVAEKWRVNTETNSWSHVLPDGVGRPIVANDYVYLIESDETTHNALRARRVTNGEIVWEVEHGRCMGSVAVSGPLVFASNSRLPDSSGGEGIIAVDALNGELQWQTELEGTVSCSPVINNGTLYISTEGGYTHEEINSFVHAISTETGEQEWRFSVSEGARHSRPAVADGTVYTGFNGVTAIDEETGTQRWRYEDQAEYYIPPVVTDETVYAMSTPDDFEMQIRAIDATNGEENWKQKLDGQSKFTPAIGENSIYIPSEHDGLYCLDRETGEQQWKYGGQYVTSPALLGETVYVGIDDSLLALDAETGTERWRFVTGSRLSHPPAIANGDIFWLADRLYGLRYGNRQVGSGGFLIPPVDIHIWERDLAVWSASSLLGAGVLAKTAKYVRERRSDGGDEATDSAQGNLERAREAINDAEAATERGDSEDALAAYRTGVSAYEAAKEQIPTVEDRYNTIQSELQEARTALETVEKTVSERNSLIDALTTAETHFQTAIGAPASDKVVITRERYRQAREAYDEALEIIEGASENLIEDGITVTPTPTVSPPPEKLSEFPGIHPQAEELLTEMDVDTLTSLRDAEDDTLETLRDADAIGPRLKTRLTALNRWHDGSEVEFTNQADVERRRELASEGYQAHQ